MMEMVLKRKQELQKKGKKGFTLVELIVVIVILGILAAIAVPALIGYINKASEDGAITEAATARTALQTIISDSVAHKGIYKGPDGQELTISTATMDQVSSAVNTLTGSNYTVTEWTIENGILVAFGVEVPSSDNEVFWTEDNGYEVIKTTP